MSRREGIRVLTPDWDVLRLFLHLLAATVWVGGQLVLAALVPVLRRVSPEAPRAAARQFGRVAWPAFWVLVATGSWNVLEADDTDADGYQATLAVKLVVVALSGATAWLHQRATTPRERAVFGALTGLTALLALFLGTLLSG
jgi:putative copper export protein